MGELSSGAIAGIVIGVILVVGGIVVGILFAIGVLGGGGGNTPIACTPGSCPASMACMDDMLCLLCNDIDLQLQFFPAEPNLTFVPIASPEATEVYNLSYIDIFSNPQEILNWDGVTIPQDMLGNITLATNTDTCLVEQTVAEMRPCNIGCSDPGTFCYNTWCVRCENISIKLRWSAVPGRIEWDSVGLGDYEVRFGLPGGGPQAEEYIYAGTTVSDNSNYWDVQFPGILNITVYYLASGTCVAYSNTLDVGSNFNITDGILKSVRNPAQPYYPVVYYVDPVTKVMRTHWTFNPGPTGTIMRPQIVSGNSYKMYYYDFDQARNNYCVLDENDRVVCNEPDEDKGFTFTSIPGAYQNLNQIMANGRYCANTDSVDGELFCDRLATTQTKLIGVFTTPPAPT